MLQLRSQLAPETRAAFAALYRLSWPVVMSRLGFMLMGLMDTLVVGHFSSAELGFHSLAWAPTSIFLVTSIGLLAQVPLTALLAVPLLGEPLQATQAAGAALVLAGIYVVNRGAAG